MSVIKDRNVVTFSSTDGTMSLVLQMDELDIKHLDEKYEAEGTHFLDGYNARIFVKTPHGVLIIVPQ